MAETLKNTVNQNKRILYVEPNDVYGNINGVPMAPDYSDYCISVNLIAEVVTRYRQTGGESAKKIVCTFSCRPGDESAKTWVSFLQGEDAKKYGGSNGNFLTTFYTDIDYDDVVKKNIVEGFGIESVQVSFESYYTPTVVIKFVDVRGSSLFGREEAVHESGEDLSSSSVFGVFFTVPYPKFKIQIKGFYGRGVTYQLTCSDFKASFNSQTGNFEAVATFIGYSYSLLTDIPLRYLVAAPYCNYIGRDYWEKHLHTPAWALSDGKHPQKLFAVIEKIKSLLNDKEIKNKLMSDEETEQKNNIKNERSQLATLATSLKEYISALRGLNETSQSIWVNGDEANDEQLIIFAHTDKVTVGDKVSLASKTFIEAFDNYNTSNRGKAFSNNFLPNSSHSSKQPNDKLVFTKLCDIVKENGVITKLTFRCEKQNVDGIRSIELNNGIRMSETLAKYLYNDSHLENNGIRDYFGEYCYIFNLNKFLGEINERIENLNKQDKDINRKVAEKVQKAASLELGFTPYIGDVFKIIMCHLETFIHMMWGCYHNIDKSNRSPEFLNLPLDKTDFAGLDENKGQIGAWPGLFNNGKKTKDGGDEDKSIESLAWVGDFSHNFEEERFVVSLYKAIRHVADDTKTPSKPLTLVSGFPIMPSDINDMSAIFGSSTENNMSALAGYLSFRAAQIFGVLLKDKPTIELAKAFGKMDAYNFFSFMQSRSELKNKYIEAASGNSMENILYGISKCSDEFNTYCQNTFQETNKARHSFETVYSINKEYNKRERHPMFVEDSSNMKYVHYYTKSKVGMVPDIIASYKKYEDTFEYKKVGDAEPYFEFKKTNSDDNAWKQDNLLHKSSDATLFGNSEVVNYINDDMFNIDTNSYLSDSVKQKYDELKSGTFKIYGDEFTDDFKNVLEKLWHVEDDDYGKYFKDNAYMLSKPLNSLGITEGELYPIGKAKDDLSNAPVTVDNEKWLETTNSSISYTSTDDDGKWVDNEGTEMSVSNLSVRYIQSVFPKSSGEYEYQNLFGDPFYYLQNDEVAKTGSETISDSDSDEDKAQKTNIRLQRQKRVKALLFLHCLNYNIKDIPQFFNRNKKSGGIYALPYGYVLLLGGLLWRKKYFDKNNVDPIQSGSNGYKTVGNGNTLFTKLKDGQYRMCALMDSDSAQKYNVTVASLFGDSWVPDYHIMNKFISVFETFVNGEWGRIMPKLELKRYEKEVTDTSTTYKVKTYTCETFKKDVALFKEELKFSLQNDRPIYVQDLKKTIERNAYILHRLGFKYFSNFFDNYRYIYVKKDFRDGGSRGLLLLLNENSVETQKILKDIYTRKVTVTDSCGYSYKCGEVSSDNEINISGEIFKAYLSSFRSKIEDIARDDNSSTLSEYDDSFTNVKRDIVLPIYLYLKTLWDRWLVSTPNRKLKDGRTISYEDYYNVENFYNSFIFIDSFYTNIYKKLLINCDSLKTSYLGRDEDGTLFQFIGDITKDHHCIFLALPDYIDMGNADSKTAVDEMKNMFRPIPYTEMNDLDCENRFVVIYSPRMSEYPTSDTGHKADYIKIWNPVTDRWDDTLPDTFTTEPVTDGNTDLVSRYGYYVPSFGVAFSRQNNNMFKAINLNMTSPLVTSASINAASRIAEMGSGSSHKVAFMGQDLYPVYSNYSYVCEIEMLGNAQVQPLMYFQLMNIPMWSGVYMIFNVTHTISAGNMVTRFKGMKLARNPLPYNSEWFMFNPEDVDYEPYETGDYSDNEEENTSNDSSDIVVISGDNYTRSNNPGNHYDESENYAGGEKGTTYTTRDSCPGGDKRVSSKIKKLYNELYEEIKNYQTKNGGKMTWNVGITSVGHGGHTKGSQHYRGYAIDLQLTKFDEKGKCKGLVSGKNKTPDKNYFIVMDILFSLHFKDIRQCIYEVYDTGQYYDPTRQYQPKCLHIGVKETDEHQKQLAHFFCDNGGYNNYIFNGKELLPEFKGIASKYYRVDKGRLKGVFINFKNYSTSQLDALFNGVGSSSTGGCDTTAVASNLNGSNKGNIKIVRYYLKQELDINDIQFCGIAGNLVQESSFNPKAEEYPGKENYGGKGIAQWTGDRRKKATEWLGKPIIKASLKEQTNLLIYELNGTEKNALKELKTATTVADAVRIFCEKYERPKAVELCQRIKYANLVKQMIDGGQI